VIVTCERCATQFQLDDSRVPAEGVRVRCSRCKHAFEVHLPGKAPAAAATDEEESDWQFNQDPPAGNPDFAFGDDGLSPREAPRRGAGRRDAEPPAPGPEEPAPASGGSSGLDLAGGPVGGDPAFEAAPAAGLDEAEPDSLFEKPAQPSLGAPPDATPDPPPAPLERSLFEAPPEEPIETPEEPTSELDALARDARESASGLDLERPARATAERDELADPAHWEPGSASAEPSDLGAPSAPQRFHVDPDELVDARPRWRGWLARTGGMAGWTLVIALFGLGLYGGLRPPAAAAPAPIAVADGLELANLSGRWIEHLEAGPIYVVRAQLVNRRGNGMRAPGLAVELLDATGSAVTSPAPLTTPHRPEDLREASLDALTAGSLGAEPVGLRPGEPREVQAVIGPLPPHARRIRIVAAEPAALARTPAPAPPAAEPEDPAAAAPESVPAEVAPPAAPAP
jgi:predicted Zn finger-like uncharacterized protein